MNVIPIPTELVIAGKPEEFEKIAAKIRDLLAKPLQPGDGLVVASCQCYVNGLSFVLHFAAERPGEPEVRRETSVTEANTIALERALDSVIPGEK